MLKIINDLKPFFEDCYRRINVREYARIVKISAPTASKLLDNYAKKELLVKSTYKNYILFHANKDSKDFIDLSRIYWRSRLSGFLSFAEKKLAYPTIILFGSLSKAEANSDSDMDIVIFSKKSKLGVSSFERKLGRKMQIFWFESLKSVKNHELMNNIINGYTLSGELEL